MARTDDKYLLYLPGDLRQRIKIASVMNRRSMKMEIVRVLEREFPALQAATGAGLTANTPAAVQSKDAQQGVPPVNQAVRSPN